MFEKPVTNIIFSGKGLAISPGIRNYTKIPLTWLLFDVVLQFLSSTIMQKKKKKKDRSYPDWNGRSETLLERT
jgi:hypothetical protein